MLFNSFEFIFLFLPAILLVYWNIYGSNKQRIITLTIFSYIFYGFWDYRFTVLMLSCTILNYYCGKKIAFTNNKKLKKLWLSVALILSLGVLAYFKYYNFFSNSINGMLSIMGVQGLIPTLNIILPVGISFYTFQALSYTIDIYRNDIRPCKQLITFACFVSLFPQLIAGPIVRYKEIEKQLHDLKSKLSDQDFMMGIIFLVSGFFKKLIIADQIALIINPYWSNYEEIGFLGVWLIVLGYSYQIYFDFSGYSDMAVGLGRLLGFKLPRNFHLPYTAKNVSDFWKRWHISLSKWLRDYLYIGLGGSHNGILYTLRNLMITMLLGGLWHGANWTFVFWGAYHGFLLILYHLIRKYNLFFFINDRASRFCTFILVIIGWVFFRSESMSKAIYILKSMFGLNEHGNGFWLEINVGFNVILLFILSSSLAHFFKDTWDIKWQSSKKSLLLLSSILVLCIVMIDQGSEFLYYQF